MFRSGQEVELNQDWTHSGYGQTVTLSKGTRIILTTNTVNHVNESSWSFTKDGNPGSVAVPETVLSKVLRPCMAMAYGLVQTEDMPDEAEVRFWAYNEKGQPISIKIPQDRNDLNGYEVTIMED